MERSLLDNFAVPTPPYPARSVATLAAVGDNEKHIPFSQRDMTEEETRKEFEWSVTEPAAESGLESAPEQKSVVEREIDQRIAEVKAAVESGRQAIEQAPPIPDATPEITAQDDANKAEAFNSIEKIDAHVKSVWKKGHPNLSKNFPGAGRKLETIEDEYDSAEAALERAHAANDQAAIKRLEGKLKEYSAVIVKKSEAAPAVPPSEVPVFDTDDRSTKGRMPMNGKWGEGIARRGIGSPPADINEEVAADISRQQASLKQKTEEPAVRDPIIPKTPTPEPIKVQPDVEKPAIGFTNEKGETVFDYDAQGNPVWLAPAQPEVPARPSSDATQPIAVKDVLEELAKQDYEKHRKEKIEAKKAMTRQHTAALKEDADREAAKARGEQVAGYDKKGNPIFESDQHEEFEHPERSTAERVTELEQHRDDALKAMEGAQRTGDRETFDVAGKMFMHARNELIKLRRQQEGSSQAPESIPVPEPTPTPEPQPEAAHPQDPETISPEAARIRELERQVAELQRQASAGRAGTGERIPTVEPEVSQEAPEQAEPEVEGEAARAAAELGGIEQMGDTSHDLGFWERQGMMMEAGLHDIGAWWATVRAKRAKDSLSKREKKVKELEKSAKEYSEKSAWNTFVSPFRYGARITYNRWREGIVRAAWERHDDSRARYENARNEVLNVVAGRMDVVLKTREERAREYAVRSEECNTRLESLTADLEEISYLFARTSDADEKALLRERIAAFHSERDEIIKVRGQAERGWQMENAQAIRLQRIKNDVLRQANPGDRPDTASGPRQILKARVKRNPAKPVSAGMPGGQPSRGAARRT
jgi:hypothetical protein